MEGVEGVEELSGLFFGGFRNWEHGSFIRERWMKAMPCRCSKAPREGAETVKAKGMLLT